MKTLYVFYKRGYPEDFRLAYCNNEEELATNALKEDGVDPTSEEIEEFLDTSEIYDINCIGGKMIKEIIFE